MLSRHRLSFLWTCSVRFGHKDMSAWRDGLSLDWGHLWRKLTNFVLCLPIFDKNECFVAQVCCPVEFRNLHPYLGGGFISCVNFIPSSSLSWTSKKVSIGYSVDKPNLVLRLLVGFCARGVPVSSCYIFCLSCVSYCLVSQTLCRMISFLIPRKYHFPGACFFSSTLDNSVNILWSIFLKLIMMEDPLWWDAKCFSPSDYCSSYFR